MTALPAQILVVEDDRDIRDATEELLAGEGYSVAAVPDGATALAWLRSAHRKPCVVLMDLTMPQASGHDVVRVMRGDAQLQHIPIIVMTAAPNPTLPPNVQLLRKPVDIDELLAFVGRYGATRQAC